MGLVTEAEVRAIITTNLTDLSSFITSANELTSTELSGKGLSTSRLKDIEKWLAAHFVAINDDKLRTVEEEVGESRRRTGENVRGVIGQGLLLTRFGQQAIVLDSTGTLAALAKIRARLTVL